ncbi:unnamed protein product [Rangifer tarandus platyrhynchus]|uniref:TNFR-Cys domain-containing protein n=1 Tax=Rangifer tarandus platyrhynchus TaxID=3082113 RepID=A0ABN8YF91_RANTA|nr:unnamed protein product [Rangifer tarandus platyrhynchus]
MTTHSSTLAWKIPWTEEHGTLNFLSCQCLRSFCHTESQSYCDNSETITTCKYCTAETMISTSNTNSCNNCVSLSQTLADINKLLLNQLFNFITKYIEQKSIKSLNGSCQHLTRHKQVVDHLVKFIKRRGLL